MKTAIVWRNGSETPVIIKYTSYHRDAFVNNGKPCVFIRFIFDEKEVGIFPMHSCCFEFNVEEIDPT